MNLGIRAILYSARKWKKTLLVFFLLLAITTLVLSGLAIADAQEEQAEELRGTTGASFTVERNLSTGGWTSGSTPTTVRSGPTVSVIGRIRIRHADRLEHAYYFMVATNCFFWKSHSTIRRMHDSGYRCRT